MTTNEFEKAMYRKRALDHHDAAMRARIAELEAERDEMDLGMERLRSEVVRLKKAMAAPDIVLAERERCAVGGAGGARADKKRSGRGRETEQELHDAGCYSQDRHSGRAGLGIGSGSTIPCSAART